MSGWQKARAERQLISASGVVRSQQAADDAALVKRALEGEVEAFDRLVQRYQPVLYNIATRITLDPEDAQDVTQTAFLRAWQNLARFDPERRFFSWLYRIALNASLSVKSRRRETVEVSEDLASSAPSAFDEVAAQQQRNSIDRAIDALPAHYREVVLLRHVAELSYQEIADALGVPEHTVKSRLFTARRRLAGQLADLEGAS